jgi:hypothetical protein
MVVGGAETDRGRHTKFATLASLRYKLTTTPGAPMSFSAMRRLMDLCAGREFLGAFAGPRPGTSGCHSVTDP